VTIPLEYLRGIQATYLPDTAVIQRATETSTGDGTSVSWATLSTVACRVSPLASGANEALAGGASIAAINQWTIWLPALTDVTVKDRIVVGARTFELSRVGARSYETARECICREIT
jgi:head-tail adaptor